MLNGKIQKTFFGCQLSPNRVLFVKAMMRRINTRLFVHCSFANSFWNWIFNKSLTWCWALKICMEIDRERRAGMLLGTPVYENYVKKGIVGYLMMYVGRLRIFLI